jgi:hypothetical protein
MKSILRRINFNVFNLIILFTVTSCKSGLTTAGKSVGIGNTVLFIIMSAVLTLIARGLASILGGIPLIGGLLRILIGIAIILWWLMLVVACIIFYGWLSIPLALLLLLIFFVCMGGPRGVIVIFIG